MRIFINIISIVILLSILYGTKSCIYDLDLECWRGFIKAMPAIPSVYVMYCMCCVEHILLTNAKRIGHKFQKLRMSSPCT